MTRTRRSVAAVALAGVLVLSLAATPAAANDSQKGRWLKIRVYGRGSDTPTVVVNLPMSFVSVAVKLLARSGVTRASIEGSIDASVDARRPRAHHEEVDLDDLLRELESMKPGQILEVQEDDDRVSIWIE